ncbi:replication initiation protein RepC [Metarhizobium album]|uniref:Replication initiation protein RepC n=1 Tax=Metarhizobium album TaxID=2182425 RepID=A0A2U2DL83_9HYPH|nr:plasmid replication protein RepC [Rhizobium album]PWE54054.1 replication initiation protein RepC [Rhizobium album]
MQIGNVTTPFGRRPITLALVRRQLQSAEVPTGKSVDKWKVFRDACEARAMLGVQDRALAVLDALLTFYPHAELGEEHGLVVFPSNAQLSIRAHGITGTTLRRHLAALVEAGLIIRKDSPNGKRYARKDGEGAIDQAYGFSLAPMLARAEELASMAQQVAAERRRFLVAKEGLSICRRDVRKLLSAAMKEGAPGDWLAVEAMFLKLVSRIPRTPGTEHLEELRDEMALLRDEIVNRLEIQAESKKTAGNAVGNDRHIQNSNTDSIHESEPRLKIKQDGRPQRRQMTEPAMPFPLGMVLKACPQIGDYGSGGMITQWRDLMTAAVVVRSMLGVSPSAYQEACDVMGPENAATAIACILERAGHIQSAGGYLRDLTRKAARGEFSLGPMLMALTRQNSGPERKSA